MAVLDEDFGTDLTPAEGGDSLWSLPMVAPTCEPLDWQSLFEQAQARVDEERVRADVAELRRRRSAPGGEGCLFARAFSGEAARHLPVQAQGGRR